MPLNIYSKKFKPVIYIFALVAICFFIAASLLEVYKIRSGISEQKLYISVIGIAANGLNCILCLLLILFPSKIGLVGFMCLFYSIWIDFSSPESVIPVFMFFIAFTNFLARGFFLENFKRKLIICIIFLVMLILFPLSFTEFSFWEAIFEKLAFTFGMAILLFFFSMFDRYKNEALILNIAELPGLTKRDCEWLNAIMNNEKYESIAIRYELSSGSVRNRMCKVFEILQVGDKLGFLNRYKNYNIIFEE